MASSASPTESSIHRSYEYRSVFGQLLTSLSTRFINMPVDAIDDSMTKALGEVGRYTQVDRCFIYQFASKQDGTASLTHEWCAPGIPSVKRLLQDIPLAPLTWTVARLTAGEIVHIPRVENLPPEAKPLRELYEKLDVRSAVNLPMFSGSRIVGMLGFSCVQGEKSWSDDSISLLRVLGEIFVNAMDRKQAVRQLHKSEERYRSVVEDQTDFIVRWKSDGQHTFVNQAVCRFFGKTREALMHENLLSAIHKEDVETVRNKVATLTPEHPSATDEHRVIMPDDSVCWHEWTDRAIFDAAGKVVEYQSVGRDITPQKMARQELEYRLKFESLLLNLSTRFIKISADQINQELIHALAQLGQFTKVDRSYVYLINDDESTAKLTYYWSAEGTPPVSPVIEQLHLNDYPWAVDILKQDKPLYIPHISALPPEAEKLRKTLEEAGIQSYINVPLLSDGKLIGLLGFSSLQQEQSWPEDSVALLRLVGSMFVNALERERVQLALQRSEERLALTVNASSDGIYDWNILTGELYLSDNGLQSLGLLPGTNLRHIDLWSEMVHPADRSNVEAVLQAHLAGFTERFECEFRLRLSDASWRWNLCRGQVTSRTDSGEPLRMVGVNHDITQDIHNRARLRESEAQLAHLARVATMGEVVAGIAHEVNQPLHAAATFATATSSALESNDPDSRERAARMVKKISGQVTRAADIIRRLRGFTQPRPAQLGLFDLNALVRESIELLSPEERRRQIRLNLELDESIPQILGDRVQIQQVLVNLLRNAYESTTQSSTHQPTVRVTTRRTKQGIETDVMDNGTGPPEGETLEKMFDSFFTTKTDGMGIGLALCRTILSAHHGRIGAEINKEAGMTFSFLLPLDEKVGK